MFSVGKATDDTHIRSRITATGTSRSSRMPDLGSTRRCTSTRRTTGRLTRSRMAGCLRRRRSRGSQSCWTSTTSRSGSGRERSSLRGMGSLLVYMVRVCSCRTRERGRSRRRRRDTRSTRTNIRGTWATVRPRPRPSGHDARTSGGGRTSLAHRSPCHGRTGPRARRGTVRMARPTLSG